MNDQLGGTGSPESGEAPDTATLRPEDLPGRDLTDPELKDLDLTRMKGLLPEHLAGTILTNRELPPEIEKFPALEQVKAISGVTRKVFIGLLAACVYCWLVIGTTTDLALILNTATTPLPIINTPIPIAGFYVVGAALLAAVYCYLHFYLLRLWRTLATLPAVFPDGVALDERTDPWLLTNLVRTEFPHLRATAPPLARLENLLTIVLAWWLVPLTLIALWVRYLPAHYIGGLVWLAFLIAATTFFGVHSFQLARATLRWELPKEPPNDRPQPLMLRLLRDARHLRPEQVLFAFVFPCALLTAASFSVVLPSPQNTPFNGARFLNDIGIRTYANLREAEVAERPEDWDDKDWSRVTRVDLGNRNLAFADATRAFLANADLRGANLTGAILERADLRGAILYDEDSGRIARLERANLTSAQLQDADLREAQLQGADLFGAQLQRADLFGAQLQGANLRGAQLKGANLVGARLQGADLRDAQLQGADLRSAQLKGADLREAALWRARVPGRPLVPGGGWDLADLRGAHVRPLDDAEIAALITQATSGRSDDEWRMRVTNRPSRPAFPEAWGSEPNVMFWRGNPEPEPFDWGPRKWVAEEYDKDLAEFLGDLACGGDLHEAQTRGLTSRALYATRHPLAGGEPDRLWHRLFAARVIGPDCPPAAGLPEDVRRRLERLAAELREEPAAGAVPDTAPPDPE
jgi:uncharacterized protein YjbI with pentapeptide repeats